MIDEQKTRKGKEMQGRALMNFGERGSRREIEAAYAGKIARTKPMKVMRIA